MSRNTLFVFAKISPKAAHLEDARAALLAMLPATHAEPGCLQFELHSSPDDGCLYLYEEWVDRQALDDHHRQPHTEAVVAQFEQWLAVPTEVTLLHRVQGATH